MYLPKIQELIEHLREDFEEKDDYNHHKLADYILETFHRVPGLPAYKGLSGEVMTAGSTIGLNVYQIRDLFLPHTLKVDWDQIRLSDIIKVLDDAMITNRIRWDITLPTHRSKGSLAETNQPHDPRWLREFSES